jgi:hypothetical protein
MFEPMEDETAISPRLGGAWKTGRVRNEGHTDRYAVLKSHPARATMTLVSRSGTEVPAASTTNPITVISIPICSQMSVAHSTCVHKNNWIIRHKTQCTKAMRPIFHVY